MGREEHKVIIKKIENLFKEFDKLPQTIQHNEIDHAEHGEYTSWINHQIISLKDAFNLLQDDSYKSVFSIIRTVFEAYWVIDLSMNGLKHDIYYEPKKGHNVQKIYQKWIKDFKDNKEEKNKQGVLAIKPPKNNKIQVIFESRVGKEIIPKYYFLFQNYNPEIAHVGLEEPYFEYETTKRVNAQLERKHKNLKRFFSFRTRIRHYLLLNDLITEEEFERARVHYNFLSMWTHPTVKSIRCIEKNIRGTGKPEDIRKYDFCLTRLALLYIGNIMCLYLNSFLKFADRQISEGKIVSIKDKDTFIDSIEQYSKNTNYFWFIYNEPDRYYREKYALKLIARKVIEDDKKGIEEMKKRISEMPVSEIEYYKNPFEILEKLSTFYNLKEN